MSDGFDSGMTAMCDEFDGFNSTCEPYYRPWKPIFSKRQNIVCNRCGQGGLSWVTTSKGYLPGRGNKVHVCDVADMFDFVEEEKNND